MNVQIFIAAALALLELVLPPVLYINKGPCRMKVVDCHIYSLARSTDLAAALLSTAVILSATVPSDVFAGWPGTPLA